MSLIVVDGPDRAMRQCLALITALAVVLSATGACDTDNLGLLHRTSLWLLICALVVSQAATFYRALATRIENRQLLGIIASAATVVMTTIELHFLKFTPLLPKEPDPPLEFLLFVLPLAGPMALLTLMLMHGTLMGSAPLRRDTPPTASARPEFSPNSSTDDWPSEAILRVTAQDHYLSVHTTQGSRLIRGRMTDALGRLANDDGIQIHRSHWIARNKIQRIVRSGRDCRVILNCGDTLPIGRGRVEALRAFIAQTD
ncbi:MAG: LytTR family DNA-binding domain-containing protein [Gammaproteobacteria bacterium]